MCVIVMLRAILVYFVCVCLYPRAMCHHLTINHGRCQLAMGISQYTLEMLVFNVLGC